jgi:hypothetical protein
LKIKKQSPLSENSSTKDNTIYRLGGLAALVVVVLTLGEIVGFIFYPQPETISDWFTLFQENMIIGLIDFWGLEVPMYLMFVFVFLALYCVLRNINEGFMAVAMIFIILGTGIFLATNNPFSMLSLSNQYAAAVTKAEQSAILAAGQAILVITGQRAVGGFNVALFLVSVAGLMVSFVMLKSNSFDKFTAIVGILANALSLADYVRQAFTTSEIMALLVILPGALLLVIWYILIGRRLYQLGK